MKTKVVTDMKQVIARVPVEVHRALKTQAAEEGRSVSGIITGLIGEYLIKTTKPRPLNSTEALLRQIKGLPKEDYP